MGRIVVSLRTLTYVGLIVPCAFIVGIINRECKFESTTAVYPTISLVTYVDPGYVKKMAYLYEWFLNVHVLHMYLGAIVLDILYGVFPLAKAGFWFTTSFVLVFLTYFTTRHNWAMFIYKFIYKPSQKPTKVLNAAADSTMGKFIFTFIGNAEQTDENELQRQEAAGMTGSVNHALFAALGATLDIDHIIVPLDEESLKIR